MVLVAELLELPPWGLVVVEAVLATLSMVALHAEAHWLPLLKPGGHHH